MRNQKTPKLTTAGRRVLIRLRAGRPHQEYLRVTLSNFNTGEGREVLEVQWTPESLSRVYVRTVERLPWDGLLGQVGRLGAHRGYAYANLTSSAAADWLLA